MFYMYSIKILVIKLLNLDKMCIMIEPYFLLFIFGYDETSEFRPGAPFTNEG